MLLELKNKIIYGPVSSRRIGKSLGINLFPSSKKCCTLDCVYCEYGWADTLPATASSFPQSRPSVQEVIESVHEKLLELQSKGSLPNSITFSGNGEPTLHPDFLSIVQAVVWLRNIIAPDTRTTVLSNSTGLARKKVRDAMSCLDQCILKLDCGTEEDFQRFNKPHKGIHLQVITDQLKSISKERPVIIQALFASGQHGNSNPQNIDAWIKRIVEIQPKAVQIYTLARGYPDYQIEPAAGVQLEEIRKNLEEVQIPAVVF